MFLPGAHLECAADPTPPTALTGGGLPAVPAGRDSQVRAAWQVGAQGAHPLNAVQVQGCRLRQGTERTSGSEKSVQV